MGSPTRALEWKREEREGVLTPSGTGVQFGGEEAGGCADAVCRASTWCASVQAGFDKYEKFHCER